MKEVSRVKPKGSVSRLRSLISPSVEPVPEGDEPPEPRKVSSWKWFTSSGGDGSSSKSDKELNTTAIVPQESKSAEILDVGDRLFSPAPLPVLEEKEKRQRQEQQQQRAQQEADEDCDSVVEMEELRNHLESTHPVEVPVPQQRGHQSHQRQSDDDIEIVDLSPGDELV
jgi:hypothetical protein